MKQKDRFGPQNTENVLSNLSIKEGQGYIIDQFTQFYAAQGYQLFSPGGLVAEEDRSVIFTGATITPLKQYLVEGVPSPGICMVQKSLRTKRLEEMTDLRVIPDWTHYFTMCGILAAPDRVHLVSSEAFDLLMNQLHVPRRHLLIEASSNGKDLSQPWKERGIEVIEDTQPAAYYQWGYGMPNIHGRGINLLLRFNEDDTYRDLGNVISIEDHHDRVLGYEFGFGLESLLSKMHGFKRPMEASIVSTIIPYKEGLMEKFADTLVAAIVIYHHGVEPGRGRERHILKKFVKGLSFLRRKMDISCEQIEEWGSGFEMAEFMTDTNSASKLVAGVERYEQQLEKFVEYASNQAHAHRLRNDDMGQKLLIKLKTQGENMGILPAEIEKVIQSVFR